MSVNLRPVVRQDFDRILPWLEDEAVIEYLNGFPMDRREMAAWFEEFWKDGQRSPALSLMIDLGREPIGFCRLTPGSSLKGMAGWTIVIGEKSLWGQGLGFKAGRQSLAHGFEQLKLWEIHSCAHVANQRSIALLEKLGFASGNLVIKEAYCRGQLVDAYRFILIKEIWQLANQRVA